MQRAHGGMGVPGAPAAMAREHFGERVGVLGQVLQRHGAVLDEAHGLAIALEAHHDVQPRLAHFPEVFLGRFLGHFHHAAGQAQLAHQLHQLAQPRQQRGTVVAGEFHQQDGSRAADEGGFYGGLEGRVGQAQLDHGAVHQLHGRGSQLHDVLGRVHGRVEGGEVDHAQHLGARQRAELQGERARVGQRALGAYQQMGQVDAAVGRVGPLALVVEDVEVVARHAAHDLGPVRVDFRPVLLRQPVHELRNARRAARGLGDGAEVQQLAIGHPGAGAAHVVHHVAVGNGARAAGVVARHAAQRGLGAGRYVHRIPQAELLEPGVEVVQHQAGLDLGRACIRVHREDVAQMLAVVDHQGRARGLPALAGAAAARQHGHLQLAGDLQGRGDVFFAGGHEDAHRHDLVDGGIGGIAPARGGVEQDLAARVRAQAARQHLADIVGRQHGAGGGHGVVGGSGKAVRGFHQHGGSHSFMVRG